MFDCAAALKGVRSPGDSVGQTMPLRATFLRLERQIRDRNSSTSSTLWATKGAMVISSPTTSRASGRPAVIISHPSESSVGLTGIVFSLLLSALSMSKTLSKN